MFLKRINSRTLGSGWLIILVLLAGQVCGQNVPSFSSLQQPSFAKIGGIGGINASLYNDGQPFYIYNPALLSSGNADILMAGYGFLPGGAGLANVNYAREFGELGTFGGSLQYLSYGPIQGYDNTGMPTTTFTPNDYTFQLAHARQANNFRLGAALKFSNTNINGYNGNALMFDIGGLFVHPDKAFTVGAVIRNFGFVTSEFTPTTKTTLPFDVQVGTTFKPQHMPIRFSITLYRLNEWNLMTDEEEISSFNSALDNGFRHVNIGAELIINKNISILAGYNHLRRRELKPANGGGFSGLSLGLDLNIKAFEFVYALGGYHMAGNNHSLSLSANLSSIRTK